MKNRGGAKNQINDLEHKEGKKHSIRTAKKKEFQKMRIRSLWDIFKCTNI